MAADDAIPQSELVRRLDRLDAKLDGVVDAAKDNYMPRELLDARFAHLEERIEHRDSAQRSQLTSLEARLQVMQNWQQWAVRLIVGTLITVLLSSIVTALFRADLLG